MDALEAGRGEEAGQEPRTDDAVVDRPVAAGDEPTRRRARRFGDRLVLRLRGDEPRLDPAPPEEGEEGVALDRGRSDRGATTSLGGGPVTISSSPVTGRMFADRSPTGRAEPWPRRPPASSPTTTEAITSRFYARLFRGAVLALEADLDSHTRCGRMDLTRPTISSSARAGRCRSCRPSAPRSSPEGCDHTTSPTRSSGPICGRTNRRPSRSRASPRPRRLIDASAPGDGCAAARTF